MMEETYTKFNNDMLEAIIQAKLNGTQYSILLTIVRYTAGFHRDEHEMSLTFLALATEKDRKQINRELTALIDRNIVRVVAIGKRGSRILALNDDFNSWLDLPLISGQSAKTQTVVSSKKLTERSANQRTELSADSLPKKESINKSLNKELNKQSVSEYTDEFEKFWTIYPRKYGKKESFKTFQKVIKQGEKAEVLITAANHYALSCKQLKTEERYIKHAKTFLNDERYKDYLERVNINGANKRTGQFDFLNDDDRHWRGDEDSESIPIDLEGLL